MRVQHTVSNFFFFLDDFLLQLKQGRYYILGLSHIPVKINTVLRISSEFNWITASKENEIQNSIWAKQHNQVYHLKKKKKKSQFGTTVGCMGSYTVISEHLFLIDSVHSCILCLSAYC